MTTKARPVAVTSGAQELRYVRGTELGGENITSDTVTACVAELGVTPDESAYADPDYLHFDTVTVNAGQEDEQVLHRVTVGVMVTELNAAAGKAYRVWALVADAPETVAIYSDAFPVT